MKILLTNDDGYNAPGLAALYSALNSHHDVTVIAPDSEKSAVSHAITLNHPVRICKIDQEAGIRGFAITGTSADCVKLGLFELFTDPPDMVISGINPGLNIGIDINYSGTVAAAREGTLNGIPSLAVSVKPGTAMDFDGMALFVRDLLNSLQKKGLPAGTFLNINGPDIPIVEVAGVRITRQALNNLSRHFEKRTDPKERAYYWYGRMDRFDGDPGTDVEALRRNYISVTPVQCDSTDYKTLSELTPFLLN